jgi:mono/diheme cytochrome c family protein
VNAVKTLRAVASLSLACATALLSGCEAGHPGRLQTATINWTKHHITVGGKKDIDPVKATPAAVEAGKQAFGSYCVSCHGRDGQNTGVPFAGAIDPPIPPLNSAAVQAYTDGQLKHLIEYGISPSGMPASKGILGDEEMWEIVAYIRHLPPAGSLGEPKAYSGDEFGDAATPSK